MEVGDKCEIFFVRS